MTQKEIDIWKNRMYFSDKRDVESAKSWVQVFDDELYPSDDVCGYYPDIFNFFEIITPEIIKDILEKYIHLDQFHLFVKGKKTGNVYF